MLGWELPPHNSGGLGVACLHLSKSLAKLGADIDFVTYSPEHGDSETTTSIDAGIIPMVTYDISESVTLYANLNFLGVYAGYQFKNDHIGIDEGWRIGAGVNADNVANSSNFQVGFTYNF